MIKTLLIITLVIASIIVIAAVILFSAIWWLTLRQPPAYALIVEKYYVCPSQKALHGGIFGKGPTKSFFPSGSRQWCWRWEWEEIDVQEFKALATAWYGVDWRNEGEWWQLK